MVPAPLAAAAMPFVMWHTETVRGRSALRQGARLAVPECAGSPGLGLGPAEQITSGLQLGLWIGSNVILLGSSVFLVYRANAEEIELGQMGIA